MFFAFIKIHSLIRLRLLRIYGFLCIKGGKTGAKCIKKSVKPFHEINLKNSIICGQKNLDIQYIVMVDSLSKYE